MIDAKKEMLWQAMVSLAPHFLPMAVKQTATMIPGQNKIQFDMNIVAELSFNAAVVMFDKLDRGNKANEDNQLFPEASHATS